VSLRTPTTDVFFPRCAIVGQTSRGPPPSPRSTSPSEESGFRELAACWGSRAHPNLQKLLAEDIPPEALRSKDQKTAIPPMHGALLNNEQNLHLFERLIFLARQNR
jgi:hypothetical protein